LLAFDSQIVGLQRLTQFKLMPIIVGKFLGALNLKPIDRDLVLGTDNVVIFERGIQRGISKPVDVIFPRTLAPQPGGQGLKKYLSWIPVETQNPASEKTVLVYV